MASAMRKMAVYLGLVEDDHRYQDKYDSYGEYEDYDDQADQAEPADEADLRGGVKRDGETGGGYVGYQAADWRAEHVSPRRPISFPPLRTIPHPNKLSPLSPKKTRFYPPLSFSGARSGGQGTGQYGVSDVVQHSGGFRTNEGAPSRERR